MKEKIYWKRDKVLDEQLRSSFPIQNCEPGNAFFCIIVPRVSIHNIPSSWVGWWSSKFKAMRRDLIPPVLILVWCHASPIGYWYVVVVLQLVSKTTFTLVRGMHRKKTVTPIILQRWFVHPLWIRWFSSNNCMNAMAEIRSGDWPLHFISL